MTTVAQSASIVKQTVRGNIRAIACAIALAHHGSIQVQSQIGLGSTFTVRLPIPDFLQE